MVRGKPNTAYIIISDTEDDVEEVEEEDDETSNSSSSSNDENSEWSGEEEEEDEDGDEDDDEEEESTDEENVDSESNTVHDEEEESTDQENVHSGSNIVHDDGAQYDRIVQLLKGGRDLESLKLEECKVYLRKHGLRLTGNKTVCTQRIQEHWRIKDGNCEKLYPRSSFSINCTGDVCKGDVVIFTQRVFGKFDKMTRGGNLLGKRIVAGRIVKESYGTAKQQHTFTVEVLWSKGIKKLPPLSPLLVKGRNLYRLKTFRQRWDNEVERSKVLAEKHKRGTAARELRARKKACSENKGSERKRHSHHEGRSPKRRRNQEHGPTSRTEKGKHDGGRGKGPLLKQPKPKKKDKHRVEKTFPTHSGPIQSNENQVPVLHLYSLNSHQMQSHPRDAVSALHASRGAFFPSYDVGSASAAAPRHYSNTAGIPMLLQEYDHGISGHYGYGLPGYHLNPRGLNYYQNQVGYTRQVPSIPLGAGQYSGLANGFLRCSTPGCGDLQGKNCVVFSCWRCCRQTGRRCPWHQH